MTATPAIETIVAELVPPQFVGLKFQFYNPRHIGSNPLSRWSQHAGSEPERGWYGNAVDIFGDTPTLDAVADYLNSHRQRFRIRVILWRVKSHFDHIHCDTWPMMKDTWWYRPPAKGGTLVTWLDDAKTESDTFDVEEEPVLKEGDTGFAVAKVQKALNGYAAMWVPTLEPLETDGIYGPATAAVVKTYQAGDGLPATGNVDGVTMALLMEYVADWIDDRTPPAIVPHDHDTRYAATVHSHPYATTNHGHKTEGNTI